MSVLSLSFIIGFRFSRERYCHNMVSLISTISTLGIALSVAVLIIGLSAINGFERELKNRILAAVPHGEIESIKQPWKNWQKALHALEKAKDISAVAPYVNFTGLIENGANICIAQIRGVDPLQEERISILPHFVQNSAWKNFSQSRKQIILGKGIYDLLQAKIGDWISITIPCTGSHCNKLNRFKQIRVQVFGVLCWNSQIGHNFAMVPLKDACAYLETDDDITGIAIKVNDIFNAKKLAQDAGEILKKDDVYIKSWIDKYGYIYHDIQMIRSIIYLSMFLIMSVACFNIVSTLVIAVKDKNRDIAILRTLGAKDNVIRTVFVWYGLLSGIKGGLLGAIIGIVISLKLTEIIRSIEKFINYKLLSSNVYFIDFIPSEIYWLDILYVVIVAILLSLAASWYPAHNTNRINPARELSR